MHFLVFFLSPWVLGALLIGIAIAFFIVTHRLEQITLVVVAVLIILSMKYLPLFFMSAAKWFANSHHKGWVLGILILLLFSSLFIAYKLENSEEDNQIVQ